MLHAPHEEQSPHGRRDSRRPRLPRGKQSKACKCYLGEELSRKDKEEGCPESSPNRPAPNLWGEGLTRPESQGFLAPTSTSFPHYSTLNGMTARIKE